MTSDLTLRDVAQAACDKHGVTGGRALDRVAKRLRVSLSYTTVDKILAGTYLSAPGRDTLDGLATLSGIPRDRVYAAAGEPLPLAPFSESLPPDADLLTPDQRRSVVAIVRSLAAANRAVAKASTGRATHDELQQEPGTQAGSTIDGGEGGARSGRGASITPLSDRRGTVPDISDDQLRAVAQGGDESGEQDAKDKAREVRERHNREH